MLSYNKAAPAGAAGAALLRKCLSALDQAFGAAFLATFLAFLCFLTGFLAMTFFTGALDASWSPERGRRGGSRSSGRGGSGVAESRHRESQSDGETGGGEDGLFHGFVPFCAGRFRVSLNRVDRCHSKQLQSVGEHPDTLCLFLGWRRTGCPFSEVLLPR